MSKGYVWVVDDDSSIRWVVVENTSFVCGYKVWNICWCRERPACSERETPDVLVSDIRMPGIDGIELLHQVHQRSDLPVIIMTAHSDLDAAVNAYQKRCLWTSAASFDIDETLTLVERAIAYSQEQKREQASEASEETNAPEIGRVKLRQCRRYFVLLARSSSAYQYQYWLMGEPGTGELVAHALHRTAQEQRSFHRSQYGGNTERPYRTELFGHEKAFTGATKFAKDALNKPTAAPYFWMR